MLCRHNPCRLVGYQEYEHSRHVINKETICLPEFLQLVDSLIDDFVVLAYVITGTGWSR